MKPFHKSIPLNFSGSSPENTQPKESAECVLSHIVTSPRERLRPTAIDQPELDVLEHASDFSIIYLGVSWQKSHCTKGSLGRKLQYLMQCLLPSVQNVQSLFN